MRRAAMVPSWGHEIKNGWFFNNGGRDERQPRYCIKKYFEDNGVAMDTIDLVDIKSCDGVIVFNIGIKDIPVLLALWYHRKLHKTIYYPVEPSVTTPIHQRGKLKKIAQMFGKVLTWSDDLVDDQKFFKLPIGIVTQEFRTGQPFASKKLLTMISGANYSADPHELYSKRIEAIRYFEKAYPDQFAFYGKRWVQGEFSSYKGTVEDKHDVYKDYKFAICYENARHMNGWITEKIFDCFYSGVVPVYWGPDNVEEYIPRECFIDKRQFVSYEELSTYLINMTEEEYSCRILAIKDFLGSQRYRQFTPMYFARTFYDHLMDIESVKFSYFVAAVNLICLIKWLRFPEGIGVPFLRKIVRTWGRIRDVSFGTDSKRIRI